jgi:hypothetical protein
MSLPNIYEVTFFSQILNKFPKLHVYYTFGHFFSYPIFQTLKELTKISFLTRNFEKTKTNHSHKMDVSALPLFKGIIFSRTQHKETTLCKAL